MRGFLLGLAVGVGATVVVAAAIWPEAVAPPPVASQEPRRPGAREQRQERSAESAPRRGPERHAAVTVAEAEGAPDSRTPPTPVPSDPVERLTRALDARNWHDVNAIVDELLGSHPDRAIPRSVVETLVSTPGSALSPGLPVDVARKAIRSWPTELLGAVLVELSAADAGTHALDAVLPDLAASVAERPHALNDLAARLSASEQERQRLAGLHLAATSTQPDFRLLAEAATDDEIADVRAAGIAHLVARAQRDDEFTGSARAIVGPLAVAVFDNGASRVERESAIAGLVFGGERGLDAAQRLLLEGGLDEWDRRRMSSTLVQGGRLPQVVAQVSDDPLLMSEIAGALFADDTPRMSDVLAIWPYVPRLMDAPDTDFDDYVPDTLVELRRFDLVEELVVSPRLSVANRVAALESLIDDDAAPKRALELADAILADGATAPALRQGVLYAVEWIGAQWHMQNTAASLAILDRSAAEDSNQWVRDAASDAGGRVRKARTKWEEANR